MARMKILFHRKIIFCEKKSVYFMKTFSNNYLYASTVLMQFERLDTQRVLHGAKSYHYTVYVAQADKVGKVLYKTR